ncbi:hypothetical protein QBC47DRAFT_410441 [Echria macrotheca]|uniref:Uncharacterized protein n=1 Tax=Echria macrotheca TaxID=438768 RepID=A0AAJ0F913_9PEZI|nr:hypothetical protein QBC47DRAFT_410441 [Echria macrotheca]
MPMQSFFTVHNELHVSLLSINVAPSAWIASLTLLLVFVYIYLPPLSAIRSWFFTFDFSSKSVARPQRASRITPIYEEEDEEDFDQPVRRRTIETSPLPPLITNYAHYDVIKKEKVKEKEREKEKVVQKKQLPQRPTIHNPLDQLDASLEDFEPSMPGSPHLYHQPRQAFGYPSAHSGFRSDDTVSEILDGDSEGESSGGYSPPAWRRLGNGDRSSGFWRKSDGLSGGLGGGGYDFEEMLSSRESSPECYESADEGDKILAKAARTRLPGSVSPEKERSPEPEFYIARQFIDEVAKIKKEKPDAGLEIPAANQNYIRFAVRAEVQQRTEPIDLAINFIRRAVRTTTGSWVSVAVSSVVAILAWAALRSLWEPASMRPVPDLVKVAGVARSFEPLIYYSENGVQQVGDLQATSVAVWDLGESVRGSNLTSAPIIVQELDDLSDSLKTLAIELTKFFANVDGDIDGILIVMDWARRELSRLQQMPLPPFATVFDNVHNMLCNAGVLEDSSTGEPTRLGLVAMSVFGPSTPQRTKQTLQRTFHEFVAILEEAISNELQHSLALFALFEAIDQQFLNLARTVIREASLEDEQHSDLLSSLWTRILGAKASDVRKYEKNRLLLQNVREKTVRNKGILVEHNHKLLALKANLENLRQKLVSPLVRSTNGSTLTLEEQIRGLEDVGVYLEGVRSRQKGKLMEVLYGSGSARERKSIGAADRIGA